MDPARRGHAAAALGLLLLIPFLGGLARPAKKLPPATEVKTILQLIGGIGNEYAEAFDDNGNLVRPNEIDEAKLLLVEANQLAEPWPDLRVSRQLKVLGTLMDQHIPPALFRTQLRAARTLITMSTGIVEDLVPPVRPSIARGRDLFQANCSGCHGATGAGDGADAARLGVKPANLSDVSFIRGETPDDAFSVISLGRRKTGMPAWGEALSVQERWDVVAYAWSLARPPDAVAEGQRLYGIHCASCHGAAGDVADATAPPPGRATRSLSALIARAKQSDNDLFDAVSNGVVRTTMPAFASVVGDAERWQVVAFVRSLSLEGIPGASSLEGERDDPVAQIMGVKRAVEDTMAAYRRGDPKAGPMSGVAYLQFEPLEPRIASIDATGMREVEQTFLQWRIALKEGTGDPETLGQAVLEHLDKTADAFRPLSSRGGIGVQSTSVPRPSALHQSLELVLILGVLAASARGSAPRVVLAAWAGAAIGIAASLTTGSTLAAFVRATPWAAGALSLVEAAALLWIARGTDRARSPGVGESAALSTIYGAAFGAGLFLQALLAGVPIAAARSGLVAGLVVVVVATVGVAALRFSPRLPLRAMGWLLCIMAFVAAGHGIHQLQESKALRLTPIGWGPQHDALGVFPTLESLSAQGIVLLGCLLFGVLPTLRRRTPGSRRDPDPTPTT